MENPQLLDYVKQQLAQNISKGVIKNNLMASGGWSVSDINEAFSALETPFDSQKITLIASKKTSKIILTVVLTLLILVIITGLFVYYQKTSSLNLLEKTQTYEAKILGLEFRYPDGWIVKNNTGRAEIMKLAVQNPINNKTINIDFDDGRQNFNNAEKFLIEPSFQVGDYPTKAYLLPVYEYAADNTLVLATNKNYHYKINTGSYYGSDTNILVTIPADEESMEISNDGLLILKSISIDKKLLGEAMVKIHEYKISQKDASITDFLRNLKVEAENYHSENKSYLNFCSSKQVLSLTTYASSTCNDSKDAYAISSALTNGYWCVDSIGYNEVVTSLINQTKCFTNPITQTDKNAPVTDSIVISFLNNLRSEAEIYYDDPQSYLGFCKKDMKIGSNGKPYPDVKITCKDSTNSYAVSSVTSKGLWCVDGLGFNGIAQSISVKSTCVK